MQLRKPGDAGEFFFAEEREGEREQEKKKFDQNKLLLNSVFDLGKD